MPRFAATLLDLREKACLQMVVLADRSCHERHWSVLEPEARFGLAIKLKAIQGAARQEGQNFGECPVPLSRGRGNSGSVQSLQCCSGIQRL